MNSLFSRKPTGFVLDPRTKLLLIVMVNVLMFSFGPPIYLYAAVVFGGLLVIASGAYRVAIVTFVSYAVVLVISRLVLRAGDAVQSLYGLIGLPIVVFFPFFIYAFLLFTTTTIGEAAASLRKMRAPNSFIIPLLVMFRFVPTIGMEFRSISNAMRLRGAIGRGNPLKAIEYVYVPLLFNMVKAGEELTLSAMTRGLALHRSATSISETKFRLADIGCLMVMLLFILASRGVFQR